jgi:hypothetical protein
MREKESILLEAWISLGDILIDVGRGDADAFEPVETVATTQTCSGGPRVEVRR